MREPVTGPARRDARPRHGPAESELRHWLSRHRRRPPRVIKGALVAAGCVFTAYAAVLVVLYATARPVFAVFAPFLFLVLVGGREPAMLYAYQTLGSDALPWVALVAVLGDVGMVLAGVPFYWWALERLRGVPGMRGILLGLERRAFTKRAFIDKWGPVGLGALVAVPAWGTGVVVAGALGLIARLALVRLFVALLVSVTIVNVAWAVLLARASDVIPDVGLWTYLPAALIVILLAGAIVGAVRERRRGEIVLPLDDHGLLDPDHLQALRDVGIRDGSDLLHVDVATLRARLDLPVGRVERVRAVAELLLLNAVEPKEAAALTGIGIAGIRDLAIAPAGLVGDALMEAGTLGSDRARLNARIREWQGDARAFSAHVPGELGGYGGEIEQPSG